MKITRKLAPALVLALALTGGSAVAAGAAGSKAGGPGNGGRPLSTVLTPEAEVAPFVGVSGASGTASLRLNPGQERICVDLTTDGFDLVLAHIHEAPRGANGPVVVDFTGLIDGDSAQGCVDVDREEVKDIIKNPADYYINVHGGVPDAPSFFQSIRGQLGR